MRWDTAVGGIFNVSLITIVQFTVGNHISEFPVYYRCIRGERDNLEKETLYINRYVCFFLLSLIRHYLGKYPIL